MSEYSKNFEKIKQYYDRGLWTEERIKSVVDKSLGITKEEFKEITNKNFEENTDK